MNRKTLGFIGGGISGGLTDEDVFDLMPVKPISEREKEIESIYDQKLKGLYNKLTS